MEGLGESILSRIEEGLAKRGAPFARLRWVLLKQEEAHHAFGARILERAIAAGEVSAEGLRGQAQAYLALVDRMVSGLADVFDSIDEDPGLYLRGARQRWPAWLPASGDWVGIEG
ncbi:hypothetical protein [Candidatus Nitrospira bockiana]